MSLQQSVPGLAALQGQTLGAGIRVAILDGPVDVTHPCFEGARLESVSTLVDDRAGPGRMSRHGTHVASILLGQPGGALPGVAPGCTGLLVPVFQDYREGELPQLDLARAVEQAVIAGAQIINISGGERSSERGDADPLLERALKLCEDNDVLVVAATGNDGCECVHVPAALPSVLAVGALGRDGHPHPSSNWGAAYLTNGLLALGEDVPGAVPGGGTADMTGSSFSTPIVAGVAALLMSLQLQAHGHTDPGEVRNALLGSATRCNPSEGVDCDRYLGGVLDIPRARTFVLRKGTRTVTDINGFGTPPAATTTTGEASATVPGADTPADSPPSGGVMHPGWGQVTPAAAGQWVPAATGTPQSPPGMMPPGAAATGGYGYPVAGVVPQQVAVPYGYVLAPAPFGGSGAATAAGPGAVPSAAAAPPMHQPDTGLPATILPSATPSGAGASESCGCGGAPADGCGCGTARPGYVYALGSVAIDYGNDTNRDSVRQAMPQVVRSGEGPDGTDIFIDANPFDVFQVTDYLSVYPHESRRIIWTLNLDLMPIYAIEPDPYYPESVYEILRTALRNQALQTDDPDYVARVNVPAVLTGRTVQLYSGQRVPLIRAVRSGMYAWNENKLLDAVVEALRGAPDAPDFDEPTVVRTVRSFLDKVYFECRNLGQSPADRALNFAVTNAYQFGSGISRGLLTGSFNVVGAADVLYTLDTIEVVRSPYCRIDSDCWDVRIKWFNPNNDRFAKSVYQFTIDVNNVVPASLAPEHQYLTT